MTLSLPDLTAAISTLFAGPAFPATTADAGTAWATLYAAYAGAAEAALPPEIGTATKPVRDDVTSATTKLAAVLGQMFDDARNAGNRYLDALLPTMSDAFAAFWPAVEFNFTDDNGTVTTGKASPTETLATPLHTFFVDGNSSSHGAAEQAASLASILDLWTRKVTVATTAPDGTQLTSVGLT